MKRYCIKNQTNRIEYIDIISKNDDGYKILITRICDGNEKTRETTITCHLFDLCVKTGYIFEYKKKAA